MRVPTKSASIARLQSALLIAQQTGNRRLEQTLIGMLRTEAARSVKSTAAVEVNVPSKDVRTVYNPKRASIKLKSELYDTRVYVAPKKVIKRRYTQSVSA